MRGYAVIDLETTGLFPERHDRIAEIAIVHVDEHGRIEHAWETLVNPMRDLGPQRIHRISAADVRQAPTFAEVANTIVELLDGRIVVAHNASFEARFLRAEFERAGMRSPVGNTDALCTMKLASLFLQGGGRSLADCCAAFDIDLDDAHEALADARATAHLLAAYLGSAPRHPIWEQYAQLAAAMVWPLVAANAKRAAWVTRNRADQVSRDFLERAMAMLPASEPVLDDHDAERQYLAMIDEALSDGYLSVDEADALHALAIELVIDADDRHEMHRRYFDDLVQVVWADGVLSDDEAEQVRAVGRMLDIADSVVASALESPHNTGPAMTQAATRAPTTDTQIALTAGALVVLTGEMHRPREVYEAALLAHGFASHDGVTKKVALVVAADVDSLSGKARKARDYGIPIVGEAWLERELQL